MKGYVNSYNRLKGCGQIISGFERFWFHKDRISKGPLHPEINDSVIFEIADKPVKPGQLRIATGIVILEKEQPVGAKFLGNQEVK